MISSSLFIVFFLVALAILFRTRNSFNLKTELWKWLMRPILILIIGVIISLVNPFSLERVDAGHIGLKVNLTGNERGVSDYVYKTGWVVFNEWTEKLYEFPTYQQHIDYNIQTVITKGGFNADIKPSFNYALIPTTVGDMFQNLRLPIKEVEQGWLKTAIVGSVNDVANKWAVDSIFNNREQFESAIVVECNKRISKWFNVSQLRTNITPPPALQSAIEAKTKALQEVQVAENQKQVAIAEAMRKIAIARGDSAKMVIEAAGEAEAIRRKQLTLSSLYIEYLKIQKWDGKNPTTVLGKEGSTIISVK
ncbi:MAG: SPFH domain-containing protein [Sediminibacterium sp.]|nr:SPFH domain-containing protein [Sediminibacterium sp.]